MSENICQMCGIDCDDDCKRYNTYPKSHDNKQFIFCTDVCLRNFIDFCLDRFGEQAKEMRKKTWRENKDIFMKYWKQNKNQGDENE